MKKFIVYTMEGCPKCAVLKAKLTQANIEFEESHDVDKVKEMGFQEFPILTVIDGEDTKIYRFKEAVDFIRSI